PTGYSFVSSSTANGSYNSGTGVWTLTNPIANGGTATLQIVATVLLTGTYNNYAQVLTSGFDPDSTPGNNSTTEDDDDTIIITPIFTGSVGDRIWYDVNGDGVQDAGEPGISGATVTLTWFGPNGLPGGGDDQVFTVTTGANGIYNRSNLPAGNY